MPLINLPTGKTISMTTYEWLFKLKDDEIDGFYQDCIADDLGIEINNPFSGKNHTIGIIIEENQDPIELE